jgi:hypothetical protein
MLALITALLQTFFIACKCAEVTAIAAWSWWLVFSPALLIILWCLVLLFFYGLAEYIGSSKKK